MRENWRELECVSGRRRGGREGRGGWDPIRDPTYGRHVVLLKRLVVLHHLTGIDERDVLRFLHAGGVSVGVVGALDASPPEGLGDLLARPVGVSLDAVAAAVAEEGLRREREGALERERLFSFGSKGGGWGGAVVSSEGRGAGASPCGSCSSWAEWWGCPRRGSPSSRSPRRPPLPCREGSRSCCRSPKLPFRGRLAPPPRRSGWRHEGRKQGSGVSRALARSIHRGGARNPPLLPSLSRARRRERKRRAQNARPWGDLERARASLPCPPSPLRPPCSPSLRLSLCLSLRYRARADAFCLAQAVSKSEQLLRSHSHVL